MKRAVIFCNGHISNYQLLQKNLSPRDFIVCADGGTNHALKLKLHPDVVIGDFDSFTPKFKKLLKKTLFLKYPQEKDQTDSHLALDYAITQGFKTIILTGITGNRLDHFLGILLRVSKVSTDLNIKIIEGNQEMFIITRKATVVGKKAELVSLIPLEGNVSGVKTSGLKYKLNHETLYFGRTRGVSNEFVNSRATIEVSRGKLLVVHTKSSG